MLTLGIDTTSSKTGIALLDDYKLIAEVKISLADPSLEFFSLLNSFLSKNGISPKEIDLLGVSVGPGSWTGIRLGLTFAKGFLSLFPQKGAFGVSTSEILDANPVADLPSPGLLGKLAYQKYRKGERGELKPLYGKTTFKCYKK